jgi:hypothetical protein
MWHVRLLAVLVLTAVSATAVVASAPSAQESAQAPLVRLVEGPDGFGDRLVTVDPRTLRPSSPGVPTFLDGLGGEFSPDGRLFAYGNGFDGRALLELIDVESWSRQARVNLGGDGPVAIFWAAPDRLIAVAGEGSRGAPRVQVVAMPGGQVLSRRTFRGRSLGAVVTPLGLVMLVSPERRIGPARILLAGLDGSLRTIPLASIRAGGGFGRAARYRAPALTVDPEGGIVYVLAAGPMLAARIDLTSGTVDYHRLRAVGSAPRATAAKGSVAAWWRMATWLGDGRIAVTGHYEPPYRPGRRRQPTNRPFGVRLVDTGDWTIRTLDPDPFLLYRAGERLLAHGTTWYDGWRRSRSTGLLAFDLQGRPAFSRFRGADVSVLGSHGRLAYVWVRPTRRLHVLDLRSGRSLRSERVRPGRLPFLFSANGADSGG